MQGSLTNCFLIAMPTLQQDYFASSLTYICEHNADGAMGLVINQASDMLLEDVFDQLELEHSVNAGRQAVLCGGPVQPEMGFILHSNETHWQTTLNISEQIAVTTSPDIISHIAHGTGPAHSVFALGYAGWGPGQLDQEMLANAWLSCTADPAVIFNTPIEQRCNAAAASLGVDLNLLVSQAGHA